MWQSAISIVLISIWLMSFSNKSLFSNVNILVSLLFFLLCSPSRTVRVSTLVWFLCLGSLTQHTGSHIQTLGKGVGWLNAKNCRWMGWLAERRWKPRATEGRRVKCSGNQEQQKAEEWNVVETKSNRRQKSEIYWKPRTTESRRVKYIGNQEQQKAEEWNILETKSNRRQKSEI